MSQSAVSWLMIQKKALLFENSYEYKVMPCPDKSLSFRAIHFSTEKYLIITCMFEIADTCQ